jgi:uncharacterized protein YbaP (TraB family)
MNKHVFFAIFLMISLQGLASNKIALWSVEHEQGKVYLLGSVHLLKEKINPYPEQIEKAFLESRILMVEAHVGSGNMLENAKKLMQAGSFDEGQSLRDFLPPQRYADLEGLLGGQGFEIGAFNHLRPWMIAMTISSLSLIKQGYNAMNGVDIDFIAQAESRKMVIEELEGVEYQINLFRNMSQEEEEAFLFSSLEKLKEQEATVDQLVAAWKVGNIRTLTELLDRQELENPKLGAFYQTLLGKRNKEMVDVIEKGLLSGERRFIIVGAAHLLGKRGILELLREKGYRISLL